MNISKQIKEIPNKCGVYFFKDEEGKILYIGKAKNLRKRVASYFNAQKDSRLVIPFLISKVRDVDYQITVNEKEALLLEATLIKQWKPRYNTDLKDDKSYSSIELQEGLGYPRLLVRRKIKGERGTFFGPYSSKGPLENVVNEVLRVFKLRTCSDHEFQRRQKPCIYYDIGRCSAPCVGFIGKEEYQRDVDEAVEFLTGKKTSLIFRLQKEMYRLSRGLEYEKAAKVRDKLTVMKYFIEKQIPGSIEAKIHEMFNLKNYPYHIECYDISNIGKTYRVGSRIVFKNGRPYKNEYRRYKIKSINAASDLLMMEEVLTRSLGEHMKRNEYPDLLLIDGGTMQLHVALKVMKKLGISTLDLLSISKAREKRGKMIDYIHVPNEATPYLIHDKEVLHYLMRIRDEAHRFAKAYHKHLRDVRFDTSVLDSISGIGPKTKRILLQHFKTLEDMRKARLEELMKIPGISKKVTKALVGAGLVPAL